LPVSSSVAAMTCISRHGLEDLLARFPALHIGVIGDFALDCYWTVDPAAELPSVETGKPTRPVAEQELHLMGTADILRTQGNKRVFQLGFAGSVCP